MILGGTLLMAVGLSASVIGGNYLVRGDELVFQYRVGFAFTWDIYLMDVERRLIAPLHEVNTPFNEYQPMWSPDGTRLAFVSERDGDREVFVWDGQTSAQLTENNYPDLDPHWSPDGTQLVFTSYQTENHSQLYLMNATGQQRRFLTLYDSMSPSWSPDGTLILFTAFQNLVPRVAVLSVAGGERRDLSNLSVTGEISPIWSPDGTQIAFLRAPSNQSDLYIMNADGSRVRRITHGFRYIADPAWSPDGGRIAFTRGGGDIFIVNVDGSQLERLTVSDAFYLGLAWRP
jgi:Tol biopolymer transport system component